MAPLCKVQLFDGAEYDEQDDKSSGPHSMLFGIKEDSVTKNLTLMDLNTVFVHESEENSDFSQSLDNCNKQNNLIQTIPNCLRNETFTAIKHNEDSNVSNNFGTTFQAENFTYLNENNFPDIVNSTKILTKVDTSTDTFSTSSSFEDNNQTVIVVNKRGAISGLKLDDFEIKLKAPKPISSLNQFPLAHSTPARTDSEVENSPRRRRVRGTPSTFVTSLEDDATKRDSLEFEESLGILTPDQMADLTGFEESRTPSSENIGSLPSDLQNYVSKLNADYKPSIELGSPNVVDASLKDFSLGIIDEHLLSNLTMKSDTTMNMELPLDTVSNQSKVYTIARLEQTPSPEDLPLDPTPIIETESKTEPTKSKTSSSFITSITSITSLDTGYQGDGEMSRPASRGPDLSPLTRRPLQRPQPRRPDPMTDSDFYTESDADNHEEHPLRGDRLARVIDGTLYGVDPQAAADIYVNNRENMDSSGIFTDIEGNTRTDELSSADNDNQNDIPDVSPSPSDTSTNTISNDSQNNVLVIINKNSVKSNCQIPENKSISSTDAPTKRKSPPPSSAASSPASVRSPRHSSRDNQKIYKMPKRNVTSKVKAVLESTSQQNKEVSRTAPKKGIGRWDAVMNKISKNTNNDKTSLKEIKPKIFTNNTNPPVRQSTLPKPTNNKLRRTRTRPDTTITIKPIESLNSSASDLSGASPAKRIGSTKKRAEVVRVTQVLTAAKLSPRSPQKNINENKKNTNTVVSGTELKYQSRRNVVPPKEKKQASSPKDCGRSTVKGGRTSPGARPPQQNRVSATPAPKTTEALAILVQHLVFNLEAFRTPSLKKQVEKNRIAAEEARSSCRQMEETLVQIQLEHARTIEEERVRCRKDIAEIIEQHRTNISQLNNQHNKAEQKLQSEYENMKQKLLSSHNEQLLKLRAECTKLQKTHEQTLEILREENDSIREEIDEKNAIIAKLERFNKDKEEKLEKEFKAKEIQYKEEIARFQEEITHLKEENIKLLQITTEGKENRFQSVLAEVESLRAVLELKQTDLSELRRSAAEANQKAELLHLTQEKLSTLTARCEDLQSQLIIKTNYEQQLINEKQKLQESLKEEFNHNKRILQHNEELQWKLSQNKEIMNCVLEQAEETAFNRSLLNSSFNERHSTPKLERALSFRERSLSNKSYSSVEGSIRSRKSKNSYNFEVDDLSPPNSPKVKGVVEKSDSVSYVLEMEESPEMIANRIVRRSFRNSTPPKTTPTKSPANKRPRMKNNPLSLSASTSAIIPNVTRNDISRSRSVSVRNGDSESGSSHSDDVFMWHLTAESSRYGYSNQEMDESNNSSLKYEHNIDLDDDNDDDLKLPALPSEIGRRNDAQALPVPKHLAGEAMVSESNSEDESTTSSSSGQL